MMKNRKIAPQWIIGGFSSGLDRCFGVFWLQTSVSPSFYFQELSNFVSDNPIIPSEYGNGRWMIKVVDSIYSISVTAGEAAKREVLLLL